MTVDEYGTVRAHALRLCLAAGATVEEAEDCVHEALVELLEVDDPASVRAPAGWVATVSRRRLIDQLRRRSRERVAGQREPSAIAPADPADLVADRDLARWARPVHGRPAALTPPKRTILQAPSVLSTSDSLDPIRRRPLSIGLVYSRI
ncbi:RNA polymerase sigma factor [Kutzneria sp. 744]|uniref:RNA polymerase sigma factor n=1 Tax=Kutzneria sp. (strain 744) TaxID=345341 RepID=UPI0003EED369|nr:sigma factor [Kutzneria sp. 744]EWM18399.1 sigma-70 factor [Kutzneria sp. 744]